MKKRFILSQVLFFLATAGSGFGQEFETSYNERFLRNSPMIGKMAPEVQLIQTDGTPFVLSDARGKYTVVVFGCLT